MVIACLTIVAIWIVLWLITFGWGSAICKAAGCYLKDRDSVLLSPWLGVAGIIAVLQVWHCLAKVNAAALLVVAFVGFSAFGLFGSYAIRSAWTSVKQYLRWAAIAAVAILWLANRSLGTQDYHDNGLYYLNAIRWNSDYAIVPGLANVHDRFGFNNANFLLHAMLEVGGLRGYTGHIWNGFFAALTVPIVAHGLYDAVYGAGRRRQLGWFTLALGMLVVTAAVLRRISTGFPDLLATLMVTIAIWRFLAITLFEEESTSLRLRRNVLAFAALSAAAVAVKLSVVFLVALARPALAACIYRVQHQRHQFALPEFVRIILLAATCGAVLIVPWTARGYILTGYPLFPSTVAAAPVDWVVPTDTAKNTRGIIYGSARTTSDNRAVGYIEGWNWVKPWFIQVVILRGPLFVAAPAAIAAACLALLLLFKLRSHEPNGPTLTQLGPYVLTSIYCIAIVTWFFTAPSPRMGSFLFWGLAAVLLGLVSQTPAHRLVERFPKLTLALLAILLLLPTLHQAVLIEWRYRKNENMPEYGSHFYYYQPFVVKTWDGFFPPLPRPTLEQRATDSGLAVYVSQDRKLVWDSPLPAVFTFNPKLRLRNPSNMAKGFTVQPSQPAATQP